MTYEPVKVDREGRSILDVKFPDSATLENTAYAIGSGMYEGMIPTQHNIELIRDYCTDKITIDQVLKSFGIKTNS